MIEATDLLKHLGVLPRVGACDGFNNAIPWMIERSHRVQPKYRYAHFAYKDCHRGDWLAWLVTHDRVVSLLPDAYRRMRLIGLGCAERAVTLYEEEFPEDDRLRDALREIERFVRGESNLNNLYRAQDTAWLIRNQRLGNGYVRAARAAFCVTEAGSVSSLTENAAYFTRSITVSQLWGKEDLREIARIVRHHVPWSILKPALLQIAREEKLA